MAQNTYKSNTFKKPEKERKSKASKNNKFNFDFFADPRFGLAFGFVILISAVFLFIAFVSYLFTGKADHSVVEGLAQGGLLESALETENWLGLYGAMASHYFIFRWFGVSAFLVPFVLFWI